MLRNPFSSPRNALSPQKTLELATIYLENARKTKDREIALVLCDDAEIALSRIKKAAKKSFKTPLSVEDQALRDRVVTACLEHRDILESLNHIKTAKVSNKRAEKSGLIQGANQLPPDASLPRNDKKIKETSPPLAAQYLPSPLSPRISQICGPAHIPPDIFSQNVAPAVAKYSLPKSSARLESTAQLAYCLTLLPTSPFPVKLLDEAERVWSQAKAEDEDEQDRLRMLATDLTVAFINDVLKSPSTVTEVVCLAPVLDQEHFRKLLTIFIDGINQATLLELHLLQGLAKLMQNASPEYLDADDLVKTLEVLTTLLKDTHKQSRQHVYKLTLVVSYVLDAMADCHVKGLKRVELHEPLSAYLDGLKNDSDPYLVYQAAYAFQALQYVPDDESPLQATLRRTRVVVKGVAGVVTAIKGFDLNGFIDGLAHIQDGLIEVYKVSKIGYDGAKALIESGQDLLDSLREGLSFAKKRAWYPALRGVDNLIRNGRLAEAKKLICEAPCRCELAFQWGVCQRLGEIAANPLWDLNTRQNAVDFLGELYKNDGEWDQQAVIKQWTLSILTQLASQPGSILQFAQALLNDLSSDGDIEKQSLYQTFMEKPQSQYPLTVAVPILEPPSLLDRVQNKPDIEADLRRLKERRLCERGDAIYVPLQAKPSVQAPDDVLFPLMDKVKDFLGSERKVMLLLGDSGAGKSTFNQILECDLWSTYKKRDGPIPLFINLPAIDKPDQDLIVKHLRKEEFTELQIKELKGYRKFVLICDGYDESQQTHNLYTSNRLNQPGEWNAQMVISCRSELLGVDYRDWFQPSDRNLQASPELFQEAVIAPFSQDQVREYIKKYVSKGTIWQVADYLKPCQSIASLQDLVKNPFILTLTVEALPRMVNPGQDLTSMRVTRVALYDQFVQQWLERGKRRLGDTDLSSQEKKDFERLADDGFTQNGIDFLKDLACAIYKHQAGYPVVTYSRKRDQGTWKHEFFSRTDENQLLLEACPLTRSGNQYRFIHKSIMEYCLARAVFEPQDAENTRRLVPVQVLTRRGSIRSVESFENQDIREESTAAVPNERAVLDSPLAWRLFISEPSIIQFLAEHVQQEPLFKQQLLAVIELSKVDEGARTAAANAITILTRAGIGLNRKDLKGIRVPGADLSGGHFDSTQLQGADLRNVNLRDVWLRQANLSNARMSGVQFGEWPYLQEDSEVSSCSYSPNGRVCAVGLSNGVISMYDTKTWAKIRTLKGHTDRVTSMTYSPSGRQIVSGSWDKTVRLWDAQTGTPGLALSSHADRVNGVTYSPNGHQIASGSEDKTVRLWDAQTGALGLILTGHTDSVTSVNYSPNGGQIASGSNDETVRLWDVQSGAPGLILTGHTDGVTSVKYSPSGHQIASGSGDKTVRLWDVQSGIPGPVLTGHTDSVTVVTYSPNGQQIVSGSGDLKVRLWDAQTGAPGPILTGHTSMVNSVTYSPSGNQIASGSSDRTVRLWDAQVSAFNPILSGHTDIVQSVTYSPRVHQIASGSLDKTLRLWDAQTGEPSLILGGHTDWIMSVAYSPNGSQLASASRDQTVRLWDAQTGAPGPILTGHTSLVSSVTYSPSGHQIASGSNDHTVRLWDSHTEAPGLILSGHTDSVTSLTYSPSGHQIASGGLDNTVRLWDAQAGTPGLILSGHTASVNSVAYSPSGHQIASASNDNTVRLWDAQTGVPGPVLNGHTNWITSVAYSPSGHQIASGGGDETVRLWDVDSGQCLVVIEDVRGVITSIAWGSTPDGIFFATGGGTSIRTWNVAEEKGRFQMHLLWCSAHGGLSLSSTSVQSAQGLGKVNIQLLTQRGAVGDPVPPLSLRQAAQKISGVASVASRLKVLRLKMPVNLTAATK